MAKFYKVIKDHPLWEVGAILHIGNNSNQYEPISDIWDKDLNIKTGGWGEGINLVENQPDWFQRVYEVSVLGRAKYLVKEEARKVHDELYKNK